ncbi:MAG TPA: hypothetical protein VJ953_18895 [Saprospiraceae bacterium]|nr:hypothetical protein [Saprospiraceae bacterium]
MKTSISKTFDIPQPLDRVADPREMVSCVPGARITEKEVLTLSNS